MEGSPDGDMRGMDDGGMEGMEGIDDMDGMEEASPSPGMDDEDAQEN